MSKRGKSGTNIRKPKKDKPKESKLKPQGLVERILSQDIDTIPIIMPVTSRQGTLRRNVPGIRSRLP
jgi:hypothetical protein